MQWSGLTSGGGSIEEGSGDKVSVLMGLLLGDDLDS